MVSLLNHRAIPPYDKRKMRGIRMAKTGTKNKSKAEEVEEEVELEDLEEDVEEDEAPTKSKSDEVEFGASDLAKHLSKLTGKTISPRELRALIRKMAREDEPRVEREITPGNRTRYNWKGGLKHPEVKRIIKAVTGGEMEADKKAKLEKLKADKAAKTAAKAKDKAKAGKKGKTKVVEPDDDDVEEIEVDDDE